MGSNTRVTSSSTTTPQACAACKYQRRKCAPDCILAPYFPHHRQRHFLNAHKLFGVSNIVKLLRNLPHPSDKDLAMRTIIFQSDVRAADPVGGCYRIIRDLHRQIDYTSAELHLVLQQLAVCRAAAAAVDDSSPSLPETALSCDPLYDSLSLYEQPREEEQEEEEYFANEREIGLWAMMQDAASSSSSLYGKESFVDEYGDDYKPTIVDIGGERVELKFDHEEEEDETIEQSDNVISKENKAMLKDQIVSFTSEDNKAAMLKEDITSVEDAQKENAKYTEFLFEKSIPNDAGMAALQL